MKTTILSLVLAAVVIVGGYQAYTIVSGGPTQANTASSTPTQIDASNNSVQGETVNANVIPVTSKDSEGNVILNVPDMRFGGDGQEDEEDEGDDDRDEGSRRTSAWKETTNPNTGTGAGTAVNAGATAAFTLATVAKHNSAASCYTVVSGKVYDLTSFISAHPGGSANIMMICGKDGTASFTDQHGGQRRPERELAGLQIGVLVK